MSTPAPPARHARRDTTAPDRRRSRRRAPRAGSPPSVPASVPHPFLTSVPDAPAPGTRSRRSPAPSSRTTAQVSQRTLTRVLGGGSGTVVVLWAVQAVPTTRLDGLFATGAHLAGLLAGYGMLVMLLLMARVPAIEHGVGADTLARLHARVGRHVLICTGAHLLLALLGFAAYTNTTVSDSWQSLLGYPALLLAAIGTLFLAAVGVLSVPKLRRRLQYETWRGVHQLAYAGAALGMVHELSGPDLLAFPVVRWLWVLLHTQVAVLVVWYRCVVPVRQALRHSLEVIEVRPEGPGVVSVLMAGSELQALRAEAGQFFRWRFLTPRLWRTALPFSLSAPVHGDILRITVKASGDHTRRIRRLQPGVRVMATGPFGAMTAHRRTQAKVLLLAGGVGITPMRALFETLPGGPGDITLLYRANGADNLVLRSELEMIAARREAGLHYLLGSSRSGMDPLAPDQLRRLVPDVAERDVYLCGPPGMTEATLRSLAQAGVPKNRIHLELFSF
ncbi:ferredoxin reductase family protein [Streptomyces sp. NPDC006430]|uniref:ferredoxin reductase family protein n=1 Tax=Streptomyces sp. NPDC006430 TaxID=3154299 RepID=UPI0033ACDE84